jgi:transcriptional regulator with XRE-family HTH domain
MPESEGALADLGRYIRAQRELARLSVRHLARISGISDSYLSQVERGLYQPSPEILRGIAEGLGVAPDQFFRRMGWLSDEDPPAGVVEAINDDRDLSQSQKAALIQIYRTMLEKD